MLAVVAISKVISVPTRTIPNHISFTSARLEKSLSKEMIDRFHLNISSFLCSPNRSNFLRSNAIYGKSDWTAFFDPTNIN